MKVYLHGSRGSKFARDLKILLEGKFYFVVSTMQGVIMQGFLAIFKIYQMIIALNSQF